MKSFMKSLPSHRKKEKERKSRHNRRRGNNSTTASNKLDDARSSHVPPADRRGERRRRGGGVMDDGDGHSSSLLQSQSQGSGSIVEATQVQYPPAAERSAMNMGLPRVSLGNNNDNNNNKNSSNTKEQKEEAVRNKQQHDPNDEDDDAAVEQNSEETILSTSTGSVVEATQIQYPLPMPRIMMEPPPPRNAIAMKDENNVHQNEEDNDNDYGGEEEEEQQQKDVQQKSSSKDDVLTSPVQSSLDITNSKYDTAYDEETVYDNPYNEEAPDEDDGGGTTMMRGFTNESIPVCGECQKDHDEDQETICNDYSSTMTKLKNNEPFANNRGGDLLGEQHQHQPQNENDNEKVIAEKQPRDETSKSDSGHHSSSNRNLSSGVNNATLVGEDDRFTESYSDTMMKQPAAYYDQNGKKDATETSIRKPRDCIDRADTIIQKRDHNTKRVDKEQISNNLHEKGTMCTSADNPRVNSAEPSKGKIHTGKRGSNRVSLETEPMGNNTGGSNRFSDERDPVTNNTTFALAGGTAKDNAHLEQRTNNSSSSATVRPGHDKVGVVATGGETLQEENVANGDTDIVLTSSDIGDCTKAMEVALKIMDANSNEDPFHGIDIEQWHSTFQDFGSYMTALGNPNSTEAKELHQINSYDKVFAIFDRGMDVNHCNAVFIYDMIRTISGGIYDHSQIRGQVECKKLDHLAVCLDMIFGVNEDDPDSPTTVFTVSISKAAKDNSTVLKFTMSLEQSSQTGATTMSTAIIPQPPSTSLPPHLYAMSQIFARYTHENMRTLQSQLDSTHKTLVATREGAMDLQKQALKLQNDLQDAHSEADQATSKLERAEAELGRQKYVFDRKEESFERVKEHYKAEVDRKESELANVKDQYERELKEAKAELARLKQFRHTEQSITEQGRADRSSKQRSYDQRSTDQRKRKESSSRREGHHSKHHRTSEHHHSKRRQSTPHPNPNPNQHADEAAEAIDDQISPSIPRKIEYFATDPYDCDLGSLDGSRKKSRRSSMSGGSSRRSRSAPYDLQPPRRPRSLSEPHRMGDSGRDGRLSGGTKHQRNPLKSLPENNHGDHSTDAWCSNLFSEKKDSRSKRRESSGRRNDRQPNNERADSREDTDNKMKTSSNSRKTIKNPYIKKPKPASNPDEPSYAFQEVVRGKDARAALPGHDCEECRKFLDALGNDTGFRDTIVQECSRHRSRFPPPSTPKDFWRMTFPDERDS